MEALETLGFGVGLVGVGIILWGVLVGLVQLVRLEVRGFKSTTTMVERTALRHQLGYYLLLGLEFLVAADIVHTILEPSLAELALLGGIILIRTVISFTLNWELRQAREERSPED